MISALLLAAAFLAPCQGGPDPAIAPLLDAAKEAIRSGRPGSALPPLAEAIRLRPGAADAHFYLGQALSKLGRAGDAVTAFERAQALQPGNDQIAWSLGLAASACGDYARAAAAFARYVEKNPGDAGGLFNLGVVRQRRGDPSAAPTLLRAWAIDPAFPELASVLLEALLAAGEVEKAGEVAETALRRSPGDGGILAFAGRARAARGDFPGAVEAFDRAIAAGNGGVEVLSERSLARGRTGDLPGAEADCRAALAREPHSGRMLFQLGTLLQRQGKREEARAALDRYREVGPILEDLRSNLDRAARDPLDAQAHMNVAGFYLRLDDLPRALEALRRAVGASPPLAQDPTARGLLLLCEGRVAEAKAAFEALMAQSPDLPDLHLYLQRCCERLGQAGEAERHRERFAALTASSRR